MSLLQFSDLLFGRQRELITAHAHGDYYEAGREGRIFTSTTTPLGLAIPLYTSVTPVGNALWNPMGSGVYAVLIDYTAAYASGAAASNAIGLMARNGMGSSIATAAPLSAFAETTPINGQLNGIVSTVVAAGSGAGKASRVRSSSAGTITLTTAPIASEWVRALFSANQEASAAATGAHGTVATSYPFNGQVWVPPGAMVWVAGTLASVALYAQSLSWEEVPV